MMVIAPAWLGGANPIISLVEKQSGQASLKKIYCKPKHVETYTQRSACVAIQFAAQENFAYFKHINTQTRKENT